MASHDDVSDNAFEIVSDVVGRDPDRLHATTSHPLVALNVCVGDGLEVMRQSIHFNGDGCRLAVEVQNEGAQRVLAAEQ